MMVQIADVSKPLASAGLGASVVLDDEDAYIEHNSNGRCAKLSSRTSKTCQAPASGTATTRLMSMSCPSRVSPGKRARPCEEHIAVEKEQGEHVLLDVCLLEFAGILRAARKEEMRHEGEEEEEAEEARRVKDKGEAEA